MMYIQYINLLDKSFKVTNIFWTSKNSLEFLSFSKDTFPNNMFSIYISKPKNTKVGQGYRHFKLLDIKLWLYHCYISVTYTTNVFYHWSHHKYS